MKRTTSRDERIQTNEIERERERTFRSLNNAQCFVSLLICARTDEQNVSFIVITKETSPLPLKKWKLYNTISGRKKKKKKKRKKGQDRFFISVI